MSDAPTLAQTASAAPTPPVPPVPVQPQPDLAPVIDVGGPRTAEPGEYGSQLRPVFIGPGQNDQVPFTLPAGDDRVRADFMASRSLASDGDPVGRLNALLAPQQKQQPQKPGTEEGEPDANEPAVDIDKPVGRVLTDAASKVQADDEAGNELDLSSALPYIPRVARDIGIGGIETPQAVIRGLVGGLQQTTQAAVDVRDAIDKVLPQWLTTSAMEPMFAAHGLPSGQAIDLLAKGEGAVHEAIPEVHSVTGGLIEQGAQFGVGLGAGGVAAKAAKLTGPAAHVLSALVAGATSTDPNAPRLSNLIDEVAPNFLTDWMKAKPGEDSALMGRLKSGLEFAGLTGLFEGLRAGLTAVKGIARRPTPELRQSALGRGPAGTLGTQEMPRPAGPPGTAEGVIPPEWEAPKEPLVEITPREKGMAETVLEQQAGMERLPPGEAGAPTGATGEAGAETMSGNVRLSPEEVSEYIEGRNADNPIRLNLQRIGSGEDIQAALEQVARTIPEPEVQSNIATIAASDALGLSPTDFLAGYSGRNLNAAETTAMRFMLDSSAKQLIEHAKGAADPLAGPEVKATFLRAFATHRALQDYFVNARAEAGRTLQSWSIMSQQRAGYTQAVQQLIEQAGNQNIGNVAAQIASLDDPLQVSRYVAASAKGTGRDTALKWFYNVLLSNPRTVVKKLASDTAQVMWNLTTNYAAEKFGNSIPAGETAQLGYGYLSSFKDAIRVAGKGLKAGESQFFKQFQSMDWMDKSRLSLLANGAPEMIPEEMPTQAGASWLRAALPTSWIGAADDFAKYLNYRAYVRGLAYRDGVANGLDGPELATHIATSLDNVPEAIHQQALTQALRSTFQEPLVGVAKTIQNLSDSINIPIWHSDFQVPLGRVIMPFVKVPLNIMKWSYRNSALNRAFPSDAVQSEFAAGGATRDLAMARTWLGTAVALGFADLALNHVITGNGPHDPQLRRAWLAAGNQPYSIQLPGQRPVGFNMVEPQGMMMGAIADTFDIMRFAREDHDGGELAMSTALGIGSAVLSKTYLQGVANVFEAFNDPDRTGDRVAQSMALSWIAPQGVAAMAHAIDPYVRAHRSLLENWESRIPWLSKGLPPARTLWGDPVPARDAYLPFVPSDSFATRMLSPWPLGMKPESVQPIDQWIWNNRASFPRAESNNLGITKAGPNVSFHVGTGVSAQYKLNAEQYDRYQVLAGNELKDPSTGMGAKDLLNGLVTGTAPRGQQDAWDKASPAVRALVVQRVVGRYRAAARETLRQEFPEIEEAIQESGQSRANQLRGVSP